jgi:hypothetical protein
MWNIVEPSRLLTSSEYKTLSPQHREAYLHNIVRETITLNKNGISISDILDTIRISSRKSIEKHLEGLLGTNEIYTKQIGKTTVYYPNGKLVHGKYQKELRLDDDQILKFQIVENSFGEFLFFHQIDRTDLGELIKGGLLIPRSKMKDLKQFIDDVDKTVKVIENGERPNQN